MLWVCYLLNTAYCDCSRCLGERRRAAGVPSFSRELVLALDVPVEVVVLLRLVVAVGALLPLYADVVLVGLMLREVAVRLRLVGTVSTLRRGCACWPCAP